MRIGILNMNKDCSQLGAIQLKEILFRINQLGWVELWFAYHDIIVGDLSSNASQDIN